MALLGYAFRPLFLGAAIFAVLGMAAWISRWLGWAFAPDHPLGVPWHAHEMALGFGGAVVGGFLLTAVATWTGRPPVQGPTLLVLVLAWLAGRVALYLAGGPVTAAIDMLYPLLLAVLATREIVAARNRRNYGVLLLMWLFAALNAGYHLGDAWPVSQMPMAAVMVHLLALLVALIGGRVVPAFTGNWLRANGIASLPSSSPVLESVILPLTALAGIAVSLAPVSPIAGMLCLATALAHGLRLSRWRGLATRQEPLVFVLHGAYAWLPAGYGLLGAGAFGLPIPPGAALHALAVGAVAGMILAMMTRVALGHTGRPLHAARLTVGAYWALLAAALLRSVGVALDPAGPALALSALAWMLAFGLFLFVYWPILTGPRPAPPAA